MSQDNVDLLKRAWAAYDVGDVDAFAKCLTEDWCEYESNGSASTLEDERGAMASHRIAFPDKHTEILRVVADDEVVACHCTITATHTGPYLGLEPTGKRVMLHEMMFNRVRDGRVCETWAMVEGAGFYEQITGHAPPERLDNMT